MVDLTGCPMSLIFLDANIVLGFWSLSKNRVSSELILPLLDIKSHIFVTKQVVDEIDRNKLRVFIESASWKRDNIPPEFPDHFVIGREYHAFNKKNRQIKADIEGAERERRELALKIAKEISTNTDQVTQVISPMLNCAFEPTMEQLVAARARKERGNPPGKKSDPLGDQISWQQILDKADGVKRVYIVTRDSDYTSDIQGSLLLNPLLSRELHDRGVRDIQVYDRLAVAIAAFKRDGMKFKTEIDDKTLNKLGKDEEKTRVISHQYWNAYGERDWVCPKCGSVNRDAGLSAHPSRYGGWSYWAICSHCGFRFDTGEPYDD